MGKPRRLDPQRQQDRKLGMQVLIQNVPQQLETPQPKSLSLYPDANNIGSVGIVHLSKAQPIQL